MEDFHLETKWENGIVFGKSIAAGDQNWNWETKVAGNTGKLLLGMYHQFGIGKDGSGFAFLIRFDLGSYWSELLFPEQTPAGRRSRNVLGGGVKSAWYDTFSLGDPQIDGSHMAIWDQSINLALTQNVLRGQTLESLWMTVQVQAPLLALCVALQKDLVKALLSLIFPQYENTRWIIATSKGC